MSDRADFLLEIGCEDLPAGDLALGLRKLKELAEENCTGKLNYEEIFTIGTARRLILIIKKIDEVAIEQTKTIIGPPIANSKDESGKWTEAAKGFARKVNAPLESLVLINQDGVEKLAFHKVEPIVKASFLLHFLSTKILLELVKSFNKTMKWGNWQLAFPRPVRWIVATLDTEIIRFQFVELDSGNQSFGHRFLAPEPFTVTSVEQYLSELSNRFVVLDGEDRRTIIREQGDKLAAERHARIVWDESLLGVVADQVEYPQTLIGEFPPEYADLPRSLISATLTGYQKYFPLEDESGKLLPCFLAIYDSSPAAEANVRHGNQSAISARLADAKFFYEHDLNQGLAAMRKQLAGRGYLPGAGTVLDKSERLIHLSEVLADAVEEGNPGIVVDREALKMAAEYCKADLESAVVGEKEFAHLQGEMGFHYALAEKLPNITALAIREHYNPRNAGDPPAATTEGRIIALADKLDHLAALASIGKLPKGGDDPFGARRAAVGVIINTLGLSEAEIAARHQSYGFDIWLHDILFAIEEKFFRNKDVAISCEKYITERFLNLIDESKLIRRDYLNGVLELHNENINSCYNRIVLIANAIKDLPEWQPLVESVKRCRNILDAAKREGIFIRSGDCRLSLMKLPEEISLFHTLESLIKHFGTDNSKYYLIGTELDHFKVLSQLRDPLHAFFDKVYVMDSDIAKRDNRLGLLGKIYEFLGNIMDFSKIEIVTKTK